MLFEETVLAKIKQVPEEERDNLLHVIDEWIERRSSAENPQALMP